MPRGAIMNTGHVRAAALAAAVIMNFAGCAAAQGDAGLVALTKPGDRNVTVAAIPSADLAGRYIAAARASFPVVDRPVDTGARSSRRAASRMASRLSGASLIMRSTSRSSSTRISGFAGFEIGMNPDGPGRGSSLGLLMRQDH